jgi:hypothetical protein
MSNTPEQGRRGGLAYLNYAQQNSGGFLSLSADNPEFESPETYLTTFTAALILNCLNQLDADPVADGIRAKAAQFLLTQRSAHGSFNYWTRGSAEAVAKPYPDDADDTFCALAALVGFDPKLWNGKMMADVTNLLVALETQAGGPYRTWLAKPDAEAAWQDVDVAVNANIAWFLEKRGILLPPLNKFLETAIGADKIDSPYYPSRYPVYYFLSRLAGLSTRKQLISSLQRYINTHPPHNPLEEALVGISLYRLRQSRYKKFLYPLLVYDFSKIAQPYAFCIDPTLHGQTYFNGSAALTVAIYLEALGLLKPQTSTPIAITKPISIPDISHRLPQTLRPIVQKYIEKLIGYNDPRHILDLPLWVSHAFGIALPSATLENLSTASLLGWIAYTIYDQVADEANAKHLPLANICLREMDHIYFHLFHNNTQGLSLYKQYMDTMDLANAPGFAAEDTTSSVQKSHGVIWSGLAPLLAAEHAPSSPEVKLCAKFLSSYIAARQLNDDAHDWQEDLAAGHITPVTKKLRDQSQFSYYWQQVVPEITREIQEALTQANSLLDNPKIVNTNPLRNLLNPLQNAVNRTDMERLKILDFLVTYETSEL